MEAEGARGARIRIPKGAAYVLKTLAAAGFEGYVVGGCVRDSLLGKTPKDWDITTNARPEQVKRLFPKTFDTGIAHGTVTVIAYGEGYEVTTYRIDGVYEDGRHPKSVTFTGRLEDDLARRDLTINAMAYSEEAGLVDVFGGREDLENRVIRAVGEPKERFSEDALRMLRTIRFAARFDAVIEEKTYAALTDLAPTLAKVSAERIRQELMGILLTDHPEYLKTAYDTGLLDVFLPEFSACFACRQNNPHHRWDVGTHILHAVAAAPAEPLLRLTMLLHDIAKPLYLTTDEDGCDHFHGHAAGSAEMTDKILRRLKFDNQTRERCRVLVAWHDTQLGTDRAGVRHSLSALGSAAFADLCRVKRADVEAQSAFKREEKLAMIDFWESEMREILEAGDPLSLKDLAVTGSDLMEAGIPAGKEVGRVLDACLEACLDDPSLNERGILLERYVRK